MKKLQKFQCLSASALKILAMLFMLCDHMWATIVPGNYWMTCVGRLAFPIFAFQVAEGYRRTHDVRAYRRRLLLWALISEIPFDLMAEGAFFYPFHQNVMFTFWLALFILGGMDRAKARGGLLRWLLTAGWMLLGYVLGTITMVDYSGYGILTVAIFYLAGELPCPRLVQLAGMVWINLFLMKGMGYDVTILGREWFIPEQIFALPALLPIWMYNGRPGAHSRAVRRLCYVFYPAHILILALIFILL